MRVIMSAGILVFAFCMLNLFPATVGITVENNGNPLFASYPGEATNKKFSEDRKLLEKSLEVLERYHEATTEEAGKIPRHFVKLVSDGRKFFEAFGPATSQAFSPDVYRGTFMVVVGKPLRMPPVIIMTDSHRWRDAKSLWTGDDPDEAVRCIAAALHHELVVHLALRQYEEPFAYDEEIRVYKALVPAEFGPNQRYVQFLLDLKQKHGKPLPLMAAQK